MKKTIFAGLFALVCGILSGCRSSESTERIAPVSPFELNRYLGTWYEIARFPHSFEKGMDQVSANYSMRSDGRVKVVNSGFRDGKRHSASAVAVFKNRPDTGELRVSFFRPFYGDYKIIYLEPDYSGAIVTSSTMNYLWILSRTPEISPERLKKYQRKIRDFGFPIEKLEYPKQSKNSATAPDA